MSSNMYRVGDHVYFEVTSSAPYQIRRIEELNRTATGNVEAKVLCFARRRDVAPQLLAVADQDNASDTKEQKPAIDNQDEIKFKCISKNPRRKCGGLPSGSENLSDNAKHELRSRELFLHRGMVDTLPATHIRGKCDVTLLCELETADCYQNKPDQFYYSLVYDSAQRSLVADKGEIRIGERYQAKCPPMLSEEEQTDHYQTAPDDREREVLMWNPAAHNLSDLEIDQYLVVARSVGTFARALDAPSAVKLPNLHLSAAAASRDITPLHAMALLHYANYDLGRAMRYLVPPPSKKEYPLEADHASGGHTTALGGPLLCRDQLEEWSASEANLFEEGMEKLGKNFGEIRKEFLPWKTYKDIVEYYYMWKTTDRFVSQKRAKAVENESKLKQVYIPSYNKPNPNLIGPTNATGEPIPFEKGCASCLSQQSVNWYAWGPSTLSMRLCNDCWQHWKRFAALKRPHEHDQYDKKDRLLGVSNGTTVSAIHSRSNVVQQPRGLLTAEQQRRALLAQSGQTMSSGQKPAGLGGNLTHKQMGRQMYLLTPWPTRTLRRLAPKATLNLKRAARRPCKSLQHRSLLQMLASVDAQQILSKARLLPAWKKISPAKVAVLPGQLIEMKQQTQHLLLAANQGVKRPAAATASTPQAPLLQSAAPSAPKQPKVNEPRCDPTLNNDQGFIHWARQRDESVFVADQTTRQMRNYLRPNETRHAARSPNKPIPLAMAMLPPVEASGRPIAEKRVPSKSPPNQSIRDGALGETEMEPMELQ